MLRFRAALLLAFLSLAPFHHARATTQADRLERDRLISILEAPVDAKNFSDAQKKAKAIDTLGAENELAAVPALIGSLDDDRALLGSDNFVGGHAANALQKITGQQFGMNKKAWQSWWNEKVNALNN